jgi:hypothetical protein
VRCRDQRPVRAPVLPGSGGPDRGTREGSATAPAGRPERSATLLAGSVRAFMWVVTDGGAVLGDITLSDVLRRLFLRPTTAAP